MGYIKQDYEQEMRALFGERGFYSEDRPWILGVDKLEFGDVNLTALQSAKPVGKAEALAFVRKFEYEYVKVLSHLEGFSTTYSEFKQLRTENLEDVIVEGDRRLSTVAGIMELMKNVFAAGEANREIDRQLLADFNSSVGFATVREKAGRWRCERSKGLDCVVRTPKGLFIPPFPGFTAADSIRRFEEFTSSVLTEFPAARAFKFEAFITYSQFFQDGNKRTAWGVMAVILLASGFIPPIPLHHESEFEKTQLELQSSANPEPRMSLLAELLIEANTIWFSDGIMAD